MEESAKKAPFKSILCGVEGNPASTIAARASIALQTPETSLRFVAVDASFELRPEYTKESLEAALAEAMKLAGEAGVTATSDMPAGKYASKVLLAEAQNHDLLVVGTHNQSRVSGIVLGSTASETVHETERPLMIARRAIGRRVSRLDAARHRWQRGLQGRGRGRRGPGGRLRREAGGAARLGRQAIRLRLGDGGTSSTRSSGPPGARPELSTVDGHPTDKIVEAAAERGTSLIVCGRRGLSGIKSLGSVSERVVHQAETSVLLVPHT